MILSNPQERLQVSPDIPTYVWKEPAHQGQYIPFVNYMPSCKGKTPFAYWSSLHTNGHLLSLPHDRVLFLECFRQFVRELDTTKSCDHTALSKCTIAVCWHVMVDAVSRILDSGMLASCNNGILLHNNDGCVIKFLSFFYFTTLQRNDLPSFPSLRWGGDKS